jgi:plastocyanin
MRKLWILVAASLLAIAVVGVGTVGIDPAGAKASKPVSIDGKVNVKGKKDVSGKTSGTIELEADNYYFNPTFVKASPGEKITVEFKNDGNTTHTFTSDTLKVDKSLASDKSTKFTFTVPSNATAFQFHCSIHEDLGMKGAVYTKTGGSAK